MLARPARAQGTEIHVLSSGSFTAAYQRLRPEFESRTGHRLVSAFGASLGPHSTALPQRLGRGEPADVVMALSDGLEALARDGHVDLTSMTSLWEHLFPAEQARIVRSLVERVVVGPAGADIRLRLDGLGGLVRDLTAIAPDALRAAA